MKNAEETDKNRQASNEPEGGHCNQVFQPHLSSHICDVGRKRVKCVSSSEGSALVKQIMLKPFLGLYVAIERIYYKKATP